MAKKTTKDAPWDRERPAGTKKTALTPAAKAKAKQRAKQAGRKYPNLVDNMAVAREQGGAKKKGAAKKGGATKGAKKKSGTRKGAAKKKTARKRSS